jgi:hypothetical protein
VYRARTERLVQPRQWLRDLGDDALLELDETVEHDLHERESIV